MIGWASLEAPAVLQRTVYERDGPFVSQRTEQEGSLLNGAWRSSLARAESL